MKWYYEWRLNKVRVKISMLEEETRIRLVDDYTAHSRLRVLRGIAGGLQKRLARMSERQSAKKGALEASNQ